MHKNGGMIKLLTELGQPRWENILLALGRGVYLAVLGPYTVEPRFNALAILVVVLLKFC